MTPVSLVFLLVERGDDKNFRMLRRKPHLTLCDKYVIFAVVFQALMVFVLSDSKRDDGTTGQGYQLSTSHCGWMTGGCRFRDRHLGLLPAVRPSWLGARAG